MSAFNIMEQLYMSASTRLTPAEKLDLGLCAHFALVGGGPANLIALDQMVSDIESLVNSQKSDVMPIHISFIDKEGQFGGGGADVYNHDDSVFHLNQPVYRMGIAYAEELQDWLVAWDHRKPQHEKQAAIQFVEEKLQQGCTIDQVCLEHSNQYLMARSFQRYDYIPRALMDQFFKEKLQALRERMDALNHRYGFGADQQLFQLDLVEAHVDNSTLLENGGITLSGWETVIVKVPHADAEECNDMGSLFNAPHQVDQRAWQSSCSYDGTIIATGHKRNPILVQFEEEDGYCATPFRTDRFDQMFSDLKEDDVIVAVGTGQAFMDFIGWYNAKGLNNKIIAVSGDLIKPWPRDHNKCPAPGTNYQFSHFTIDAVRDIVNKPGQTPDAMIDDLRELIQKEMHCESALKQDPQNVISTFFAIAEETYKPIFGEEHSNAFDAARSLFKGQDANSTLPERFEAMRRLENTAMPDGTPVLEFRRGRVNSEKCFRRADGKFILDLGFAGSEDFVLEADRVINTAAINRVPYSQHTGHMVDTLHDDMTLNEGMAAFNPSTRMIESAIGPRVAFNGAGAGGPFGIPYIRSSCQHSASSVLKAGLERARAREAEVLASLDAEL